MRTVLAILVITVTSFLSTTIFAAYGAKICDSNPGLYCYKVKKGDSWRTLFQDPEERNLVMRINRMNISLQRGMKIAIPKEMANATMLDFAPFDNKIAASGKKVIVVSLSKLAFGAYGAEGNLEHWGPISSARGYCPDIHRRCHTPTGNFAVYTKAGPGCISTKYPVGRGGAPMPYCMFFHGGFALHGSHDVPGYNASHGCVRLFVDDAKWLNLNFVGQHNVAVLIRN